MTARQQSPTSGHAIAYLRVSTDEQSQSGLGLDAQAAAIAQAARRANLTITATFTDAGRSGALPIAKRPELAAALATLGAGDVLLVAKRDRLGRDAVQTAMIEAAAKKKKARVVSAAGEGSDGDDPSNILMRGIIDQFSQHERLLIKARTSAALAAKRSRGERSGTLPYGWRLAPRPATLDPRQTWTALEPQPAERDMLQFAAECRHALGCTWQDTADALNRDGYRTRAGQPWTLHGIRSALLTCDRHRAEGAPTALQTALANGSLTGTHG